MVKFSRKEIDFLNANETCALATLSKDMPHVVGVCYVLLDGYVWIATDYGTRKYKNVKQNPKVALTVYGYRPARGIMIQGEAEIIEKGPEFKRIYSVFDKRFAWVGADPWKEGEAPFLKIKPLRKAGWGL